MTIPDQQSYAADNSLNNLFGAFSSVIGYIGAEAATSRSFEQLLWPQRSMSGFTLSSVPHIAFLHSMGGPLHKVALQTMDSFNNHGLLKGSFQGHMLSTSFFPELGWKYTMYENDKLEPHTGLLRNCLWARVFMCLGTPKSTVQNHKQGTEKGGSTQPLRAQFTVGHLTLTKPRPSDANLPFVSEAVVGLPVRVVLGVITAEMVGIIMAITLFITYQTFWSLFWLAPLALRLFSVFLALRREPLISLSSDLANDPPVDFQIHCPQSEGGDFFLITGPPALVLQFNRHYGHPIRSRFREVSQIFITIALGSNFAVGLLSSSLWMPLPLQYAWLGYQVYAVMAMYLARYSNASNVASTEMNIAKVFNQENGDNKERALLFGNQSDDSATIKASLVVTYHARYKDGEKCLNKLLRRSKMERPLELGTGSVPHSPLPKTALVASGRKEVVQ